VCSQPVSFLGLQATAIKLQRPRLAQRALVATRARTIREAGKGATSPRGVAALTGVRVLSSIDLPLGELANYAAASKLCVGIEEVFS
jgi:hypothetical protein